MPYEAERKPANPFVYLWVLTGVALNISGLASVASDIVKWVSFFKNFWMVYQDWIRTPIHKALMSAWPAWLPPLPQGFADWLVIWSGLWLAISVYYYQALGIFPLHQQFQATKQRIDDALFHGGIYWLLSDLYSFFAALISTVVMYITKPAALILMAFMKKISPEDLVAAQRRRDLAWKTNQDVDALLEKSNRNEWISADIVDQLKPIAPYQLPPSGEGLLARWVKKTLDANGDKKLRANLRELKSFIAKDILALSKRIIKNDEIDVARRVLLYYGCIVVLFVCVLFVNFTMLRMET